MYCLAEHFQSRFAEFVSRDGAVAKRRRIIEEGNLDDDWDTTMEAEAMSQTAARARDLQYADKEEDEAELGTDEDVWRNMIPIQGVDNNGQDLPMYFDRYARDRLKVQTKKDDEEHQEQIFLAVHSVLEHYFNKSKLSGNAWTNQEWKAALCFHPAH